MLYNCNMKCLNCFLRLCNRNFQNYVTKNSFGKFFDKKRIKKIIYNVSTNIGTTYS